MKEDSLMNSFKTIKENKKAQIVEKKSKFIANIIVVESQKEAEDMISKIKKEYYDAKHNCFAYIVYGENKEIIKRFSDDGEPSGTAGAPILEILEKQNLCNVLVVVTRYFGGILLGTGGLVRAYSEATLKALDNTEHVTKIIGFEVSIEVDYKKLKDLKYFLEKENIKIIDTKYLENVEITAEIPENKLSLILENVKKNIIKQQIKTKKYIEI